MVLSAGTAARAVRAEHPAVETTARYGAFDVLDYDDAIEVDRPRKLIEGRERIRLRAVEDDTSVLAFPRNAIEVLAPEADHGTTVTGTVRGDRLEIRFSRPLERDQVTTLTIAYRAVRPAGIEFHDDAVYSSFDTCHWMICRDDPGDKATLTLRISAPKDMTVVASGEFVEGHDDRGSRVTLWREPVPYSPYLFGFVIGKLTRFSARRGNVQLDIYATGAADQPATIRHMFEQSGAVLDFLVEKAGQPLPHGRYRQIVVDGDASQEATSFSILGRKHLEGLSTKSRRTWIIAHEMAHQYWGNLITCARWADFWLNEAVAVFITAAYDERRWGRAAYDDDLAEARTRLQAAMDAHFDVPIAFEGEYPSLQIKRAIVYSKGALFLAALRATMGDDAFWSALKTYSRSHSGGVVTTEDFRRTFTTRSRPESRDAVSKLFRDWVLPSNTPPAPPDVPRGRVRP